MKKKVFALMLCIAMLAIAVVGGTMAYFMDSDEVTNTFTVGNVDIALYESTLHRQNDSATDEQIIADAADYQSYLAEQGSKLVPGRWVKKAPYVLNTGDNAAFVRIKATMSDAIWETTELMEYTTAQENGAIVAEIVENGDGTWTLVYTYTQPVEPGEMTYYSPFWQIRVAPSLDNADLEVWSESETIKVVAEAIQSEGFDDYAKAFEAFDAQKAATP